MAVRKTNVHKIRRTQRRRHKGLRCSLEMLRLAGFFFAVFLLAEPFCVGELTCVLSGEGDRFGLLGPSPTDLLPE